MWTRNKGIIMLNQLTTRAFVGLVSRLRNDDTGATAVEYGLIFGLIVVMIIAAIAALATMLSGEYLGVVAQLDGSVVSVT